MAMVLASKIEQVEKVRELLGTDVEKGTQALLGCHLVKGEMIAQIVEVEAYTWDDPGCHAYKRERMKNMAMYGKPGTAYVYFTYGHHWMINVVGDRDGVAGAALIRAAMPISGHEQFRANRPGINKDRDLLAGPGRLTKGFEIDSRYNMIDLLDPKSSIHIVSTGIVPRIGISPRIGIAIGKGDELLRRYVDLNFLEWATKHNINTRTFM